MARRWGTGGGEKLNCKTKNCRNDRAPGRTLCHTCKNLVHRYGVTAPARKKLLREQNNSCALCRNKIKFTGDTSQLGACLDHCHSTGRIRGILCGTCNTWLGYYENKKIDLSILRDYTGGAGWEETHIQRTPGTHCSRFWLWVEFFLSFAILQFFNLNLCSITEVAWHGKILN